MSDITLHPELGVNPRLTFCPGCGGAGQDLMLFGNRNYVDECRECGMKHYGGANRRRTRKKCQRCGHDCFDRRILTDQEKVPSSELCECCKKKNEVFQNELKELYEEYKPAFEAGAVFSTCEKCNSLMIVNGEAELAKHMRECHGIAPPKPFVVSVPGCPNCYAPENEEFNRGKD